MTSRWAVEVAPRRDVPVRWRAFSLALKNADGAVAESDGSDSATSHRALRAIEAVRADHGDEPVGPLYTEIGTRFHIEDDKSLDAVAGALDASGLDAAYAYAADDDRWDAPIRDSMDEAIELVGTDVGVPILVFRHGDDRAALWGPVVSPVPSGAEALSVWDGVLALAWSPSFYELKRTRTGPPQL